MSASTAHSALSSRVVIARKQRGALKIRSVVPWIAAAVILAVMALSTKVVKMNSGADVQSGAFTPAAYGAAQFPKVQAAIEQRAVSVTTLAQAIAKDPAAAAKQYGIPTGAGPEFSVKFSGVVGKDDLGTYDVAVPGLPKSVVIQVQTGPAIIGTDLRDATGTIKFEQFTNQIEYQNAGAALNTAMKQQVLAKVDAANFKGKTISVVGAFQLSDPKSWVVTPAKLGIR